VHLAVIILTKDEENNLPGCLASISGLPADVFVIDSGSSDRTVEIAEEVGATVLFHAWETPARQLNWAIENIVSPAEWILRLDADERVSAELFEALRDRLVGTSSDTAAYALRLRMEFLGRWMRHGGLYPIWLVRLFRRGATRCEDRSQDEHMLVLGGKTESWPFDFIHIVGHDIESWMRKHVGYATRECAEILKAKNRSGATLHWHARVKRWIRTVVYQRSPLFLRAWAYWAFRYFVRGGFLDGVEGFMYHFFQCLWYRSLVDAQVYLARQRQTTDAVKSDAPAATAQCKAVK
jgi:glycosyltransferase involved in cell wall biosynthesis